MQANDCYLTDEQEIILKKLIQWLEEQRIPNELRFVFTSNHENTILMLPIEDKEVEGFFNQKINYGTIMTFVECGFFQEKSDGEYLIQKSRTKRAIENNFGETKQQLKAPISQKNYKGLSEEHWNFLVLMAKAIRGKYIKNPSAASKGFYILPVIENGKILEFKNFLEIFLQAHQNELGISLKAFLDLAALGYFEKAKGGNYYLIESKILPAVDEYEAQENGETASNSTPLQPEFQCDIFMVMPFRESLDGVYHNLIVPTVRELSLSIRRGDERQKASANIVDEVFAYIKNAKIVLVDCTEIDEKPNGNVYYELGYADALDKSKVILISQTNATDLPFDIKHRGVIEYKDNAKGNVKLREDLRKAIQGILGEHN